MSMHQSWFAYLNYPEESAPNGDRIRMTDVGGQIQFEFRTPGQGRLIATELRRLADEIEKAVLPK